MARWTSITPDDLNDTKVAALVTALRTAALGSGQDDPVEEITANVVSRIRAEIRSCLDNLLDTDETTIPRDLKSLACRMVVREMQSRLQEALTEDERGEMRADLRYLERIAEGKVSIATPDNPQASSEVQTAGAIQIARKGCRRVTRETMEGL